MRYTTFFILIFVLLTLDQTANGRPIVSKVKLGENGISTRLVIAISELVNFDLHVLDKPYRLVIDFPSVVWELDKEITTTKVSSVTGIRFADFENSTSRVVLDLQSPVEVKKAYIQKSNNTPYFQFVLDFDNLWTGPSKLSHKRKIDIQNTNIEINQTASKNTSKSLEQQSVFSKDVPKPFPKPFLGEYNDKKIVVVIDAGHGGKDPGAVIGKNRYFEKHIAFAAAKTLKIILEKLGYKAILSRSGDYYISLGERLRIAQINSANLFVSLHADKHPDKDVNGIAVYTLSTKASDAESEALAKRENEVDIIFDSKFSGTYDQELRQILISLFQRTTMTCSAQVANQFVHQLRKSHRLLRSPHRFAGFKVLKSPRIPSVLIEMGYLSNAEDRKTLLSERGRYAIMLGVGRAIDTYFHSNKACLMSS